jgi:hypothetical protein
MIARPTVESLLEAHGNTVAGRKKARAVMTAAIMASAQREAEIAGRSWNCEVGHHRRIVDAYAVGCANDGSGCLCDCHDDQVGGVSNDQ